MSGIRTSERRQAIFEKANRLAGLGSEKREARGVLLTLKWYNFPVSHSSCPGQFQNFSLHDPLYGKLFSAYLRPPHKPRSTSQIPNASSPSSPTALANGTVQAPKQKGD